MLVYKSKKYVDLSDARETAFLFDKTLVTR